MSSALLIIDPQVGWRHESVDHIYPNILKLAKAFEGPVFTMKFVNPPESPFTTRLKWTRFSDETDQALNEGFAEVSDAVIEHDTYGCLNDELEALLQRHEISDVYTCGVFTDVCIAMTGMQIFDSDRASYIVTDLVGSLHGRKIHEASLRSFEQVFGNRYLVTAEQVPQK